MPCDKKPNRIRRDSTNGATDEEEAYERREYIPMHLDVEAIDADEVEVLRASG